jgi:hypothetical protein
MILCKAMLCYKWKTVTHCEEQDRRYHQALSTEYSEDNTVSYFIACNRKMSLEANTTQEGDPNARSFS